MQRAKDNVCVPYVGMVFTLPNAKDKEPMSLQPYVGVVFTLPNAKDKEPMSLQPCVGVVFISEGKGQRTHVCVRRICRNGLHRSDGNRVS